MLAGYNYVIVIYDCRLVAGNARPKLKVLVEKDFKPSAGLQVPLPRVIN